MAYVLASPIRNIDCLCIPPDYAAAIYGPLWRRIQFSVDSLERMQVGLAERSLVEPNNLLDFVLEFGLGLLAYLL